MGKPGETFGASFDPEAELNWRDKRFGPFAGGSFGRVFEGCLRRRDPALMGRYLGVSPRRRASLFSPESTLLSMVRLPIVKMNATASGMSAMERMFFEAGEGLEWARSAWSQRGSSDNAGEHVGCPAKDIDGGLGVLGLRSEGVERSALVDLETFRGWLVK